jgi:hypothetical protein
MPPLEAEMRCWSYPNEPKLDELLEDDVLRTVVRSTGLSAGEFREELARLACRLHKNRARPDRRSERACA